MICSGDWDIVSVYPVSQMDKEEDNQQGKQFAVNKKKTLDFASLAKLAAAPQWRVRNSDVKHLNKNGSTNDYFLYIGCWWAF